MRIVIQVISILFSIALIILAGMVLPAAEGTIKLLAIVGIITATLCIIAVIAWIILYNCYVSETEENRLWGLKRL